MPVSKKRKKTKVAGMIKMTEQFGVDHPVTKSGHNHVYGFGTVKKGSGPASYGVGKPQNSANLRKKKTKRTTRIA
jgi:hypothetical protein